MKINDVVGLMTSAFHDWNQYIINNRYVRKGQEITWNGYDKGLLFASPDIDDFIRLREERQYSFQIGEDDSIFQIYYLFDNISEFLIKANLSFYKLINVLSYEIESFDEEQADILPGNTVNQFVSWLRIDFESSNHGGVLHGESHMHISGMPNGRILVRGVPNPKQFVEFVMANFYPEIYRKHRCNDEGNYLDRTKMETINNPCQQVIDREVYPLMSHLFIPGCQ